uniref:Retinoic acid receptor responder protein 2 n=1 Tax=Periophthalmus magnuspinnatus TaxID=409849 RepID=A0A3B4AI00_9GOBI
MMALFLLVVLSIQALVLSTQGQEAFNNLSEDFKKGVNLALEKLSTHAGVQHHFLFFRSITQSDINPGFDVRYIYHHFLLKPTHCPKGTTESTGCHFRNDRPPIDCAVCYKTFGGNIEVEPRPYVHCIHKPSLTEEMKTLRIKQCNIIGYGSGTPTLLASRGD